VHQSVLDYSTTPARVDHQLAAAAVAQVALLGALAYEVGLGPVGWLAGVAYALGLSVLLGGAARRAGATALGPADVVTLARASLAGGVTALVTDRLGGDGYPVATLVLLSSVALALDGVDGWVARRTRTVSALGARFDMEVDAFLVLVLSAHVAVLVTPWALVIGLMRYVFMVATWLLPWLSGALPTRYSAKVVAAVQGIVLVVASGQFLAPVAATALVVAALAALLWSFGKSVTWLWRARMIRPGRVEAGSITARPRAAAPPLIRHGASASPLIRHGATASHGVRGGRVEAGSVTARGGRVEAGSVRARGGAPVRPTRLAVLRPVRTPAR
jgi:phosphatidylglycerophosphate synthase